MSAAERLLDSLRDLLYAWTYRLTARQSAATRAHRGSHEPRIDLDALVERHESRQTPTSMNSVVVRERVTMNDQAVSRLYEPRDRTPSSHWPD
ncbi:MAG TPA: hypothetical protein VH277_07910 [Gemmatimonadaceae bacterium]|nr:hypothetical protein [Gemmatimonadaceae bacterium]